MAKTGNYIIVYRNNTVVAGVKSNDISTSADTEEVASSTSGDWKEYIAGRKDWSLSVNYLLLADADMLELLNVGTIYTLKIGGRSASNANTLTGSAIMTVCRISAINGNLAQGSFTFKGTGQLAPVGT
jgi:predicted secreted protein